MNDSLYFLPLHNSYGVLDVILVGDGRQAREFRSPHQIHDALLRIGVDTSELRTQIDSLNEGLILNVEVSQNQYIAFYSNEITNGLPRERTGRLQL